MDLYQKVYKDGKCEELTDFIVSHYKRYNITGSLNPWRFCLDGNDYEARCKMVAEFYSWEEK